jgi:hypothetical protein
MAKKKSSRKRPSPSRSKSAGRVKKQKSFLQKIFAGATTTAPARAAYKFLKKKRRSVSHGKRGKSVYNYLPPRAKSFLGRKRKALGPII